MSASKARSASATARPSSAISTSVQHVVFLALVLDLLAFTIPLPLFPRIIEWYTLRESGDTTGFLNRTLAVVGRLRGLLLAELDESVKRKWDVVLLGGLMGSLFSALQFAISPYLGSLSDKYGRKKILLLSMIGNLLSAFVWVQSTSFASFMLARAIGGISEGNVQLSIAILSDVTSPATRGKALSLVGIAFGVCFCIGPPLGAYFASKPFTPSLPAAINMELNVYATPALLTLLLLVIETAFLGYFLPETKGKGRLVDLDELEEEAEKNSTGQKNAVRAKAEPKERVRMLGILRRYHFAFLVFFSGVEFTLTFLSFDLFDWTNAQNGRLLAFIGILSTLLQGGYVRRALARTGEVRMARRGVSATVVSLFLLTSLPFLAAREGGRGRAVGVMYLAAAFLAFTSATVVNSLTAAASLQCDDDDEEAKKSSGKERELLVKGKALGKFRSSGQLGRALGPILACASYWTFGPSPTYAVAAAALFVLAQHMRKSTTASSKVKKNE